MLTTGAIPGFAFLRLSYRKESKKGDKIMEKKYNQFAVDMEDAGYKIEDYEGRNFYSGPAIFIETEELQDVIRATAVKLQWDTMGRSGLVIYPQ